MPGSVESPDRAELIRSIWGIAKKGLGLKDSELYGIVLELTGYESISSLNTEALERIRNHLEQRAGSQSEAPAGRTISLPEVIRAVLYDASGKPMATVSLHGKTVNRTFVAYSGSVETPDASSGLRLKFDVTMSARALD